MVRNKKRYFAVTMMGSKDGTNAHSSFWIESTGFPPAEFMKQRASKNSKSLIPPENYVPIFIHEFKSKKDFDSFREKEWSDGKKKNDGGE